MRIFVVRLPLFTHDPSKVDLSCRSSMITKPPALGQGEALRADLRFLIQRIFLLGVDYGCIFQRAYS